MMQKRGFLSLFALFALQLVIPAAHAQGGFGGGGGMMQQNRQGTGAQETATLDNQINEYWTGPELKSILTPGEFVEYKLTLKAKQVLFAQARSDAFDPALEVLDEARKKVLADNDDRYPGDQRPLLMWRCPADGVYYLHIRSFRDKSGGQVFTQFSTFNSYDVGVGKQEDFDVDASQPILVHMPLKAGELRDFHVYQQWQGGYFNPEVGNLISPLGLPTPDLTARINLPSGDQSSSKLLLAPVAGDYYLWINPQQRPRPMTAKLAFGRDAAKVNMGSFNFSKEPGQILKIRVAQFVITPTALATPNLIAEATGHSDELKVWELNLKAGDFAKFEADALTAFCNRAVMNAPDVSGFTLDDPEKNPFFPGVPLTDPKAGHTRELALRARDSRGLALFAEKDLKVWLAIRGRAPGSKDFTLKVSPAAQPFDPKIGAAGNIKIGQTSWWSFSANAGDVLTFNAKAVGFAGFVTLLNPSADQIETNQLYNIETEGGEDNWNLVSQATGRFLIGMACDGNGGSGAYTMHRQVIPPQTFSVKQPAKGEIKAGEIKVLKFTASPEEPLLLKWHSMTGYTYYVTDEKGERIGLPIQPISGADWFGILKVEKKTSYIVVITGYAPKPSPYEIELKPLASIQ